MTTPANNAYSVYARRLVPSDATKLAGWLGLELANIQRAIRTPQTVSTAANYTATTAEDLVLVDATAGAITVTLPDPARAVNGTWTIKKVDASGNAVTVAAAVTTTFDAGATLSLPAQYDAATVRSTGTGYVILSTV
jgi:hypothetical protein